MTQVFVIHGGDAFATYEEYLENLKSYIIDIDKLKTKGWKNALPEALGESYEVIAPRMPNAQNAKYNEWKMWFEKHIPFMRDNLILVGHSLGGVFLAKYLSEHKLPKKINGVFIVAAPFDRDYSRPLVEFAITDSLAQLAEQGGEIFFYHSSDDPIVEFTELEKYRKEVPKAHFREFNNRLHFHKTDTFPELVADIKSLHG